MKKVDDRPRDWSQEERAYNRSVKIRRHVILWLDKNVNRQWNDLMDIASECANDMKLPFSSVTAYRWIGQFTAANFSFSIVEGDLGHQLIRRRRLTENDFVRWGIPVPKRFKGKKK